jgi:uncharacterized protein (TIGR03437 family)
LLFCYHRAKVQAAMSRSGTRLLIFLAAIGLLSAMSFAQPAMLTFRPAAAAYSTALDRLILVSGNPNALHIYDPVSGKDVTVNLAQPPLSLSVSPDGLHAAVGHDALISYVNLSSAAVEKQFTVAVTANSVVLSASWIYVLPTYYAGSASVNLATGAVTPNNNVFYGTYGWLNPAVNAIYGTQDGSSPNDLLEYNISTGPITRQSDSPYHGDYCINGPLWFSPDGGRIYTGCGTVFHASTDPNLDRYYLSSLPAVSSVQTLAESSAIHKIALVPRVPSYSTDPAALASDGVVRLFDSAYLQPAGQFALPGFSVDGAKYQAHGKWVFFNSASTELYVLMEADKNSGLLNDFALYGISMGAPVPCGAAFQSSTAHVAATGSIGSVQVAAPATCIYQATSLSPWVQIVSGSYGSGNGTLAFLARPNFDAAPRSGAISLGDQTFTVNQDGASSPGPLASLGYNVVDAAYAKPLDRIVLVSANPDELHIYDPGTNSEQIVALALAPLCVSVQPDGAYAAVGHDGWVSYVNLRTPAVEKLFQVVTDVSHVLLAGNGYIYLFPARDWSDIYSLEVSSGTVTGTSAIYDGRVPRLYASWKYMYVGGNWFSKWDISSGVAKLVDSNFGLSTCGNLWLTQDGRRDITACGKVYTTSDIPAQDSQYNGTLSAASSIVWADESVQQGTTAVIPAANGYSSSNALQPGDTQVQLYGDAYLAYLGAIPLPQFVVGGVSFAGHGQFVFWNGDATALYVVMQADSSAQLLPGSAVARVLPSSALNVTVSGIVNAASQTPGRLAPGELVTIYGTGLGPSNGVSFSVDPVTNKVDTALGGTQVFFNGTAAPVLYASGGQVNAIVPYEVAYSSQVTMQVAYQSILSSGTTLSVASAMPGLFTVSGNGAGQAAALNLDGTVCDSSHPAASGSYVTLYITGGGGTNPPGVTGGISGLGLKYLAQTALATVGGQPAGVVFAGAAPTLVDGVDQVNIKLADNTPSGPAQPVIVTVGINSSPATATIAVR